MEAEPQNRMIDAVVSRHRQRLAERVAHFLRTTAPESADTSLPSDEEFASALETGCEVWLREVLSDACHQFALQGHLAERKLRESEARLASVIENTPGVAVQFYDRQGRVRLWNRASEAMFGFTASEAAGKTLDQLIHTPDEFAGLLATIEEIDRTGRPLPPTEFAFRRRDGSSGTCVSTLFRIPGEQDLPWFVCVDVDITAAKRLEESQAHRRWVLEDIAKRLPLQTLLNEIVKLVEKQLPGSRCSVLLLDETRRFLRLGAVDSLPAAYNALLDGFPIGPAQGSCGTAAWSGEPVLCGDIATDPLWRECYPRFREFGFRACWSYPILMAKTAERPDRASRVMGTFAVYFNVPCAAAPGKLEILEQAAHLASIALEREHIDRLLRKEQLLNERIAQASPLMIFVFDFDEQKVVYRNRHIGAELGYTPEQIEKLEQDPFPSLMHPDDRARLSELRERWKDVSDRDVLELEMRFRHASGEWHWFLVRDTVFARSADGSVKQIIGMALDITARRSLEEQLLRTQKLEAVGRLAGGIAHDFNNLLTVINGYSDLMSDALPAEDTAAKACAAIRDAGRRAAKLTGQLLAFSRKAVLEPQVIELHALLREAEPLLQRFLKSEMELTLQLANTPAHISADPGQIEQAIVNLCLNARDAMPQGGRLTISTQLPVASSMDATDQGVEICVSDTGSGMTAEVLARIYEPFFSTKPQGEGTGLGLSVVHGVVQRNQGRISVQSQTGLGSTFRLWFPLVTSCPVALNKPHSATAPRGSETVLLVEDDDAVRDLARFTLEMHGYRVLTAACGADALRIAEENQRHFDMLVTDLKMAGMTGRELAAALREQIPDLRVLFISAFTDDELVQQHVESAAGDLLAKPFTPVALARRVRAILDRRPVSSAATRS